MNATATAARRIIKARRNEAKAHRTGLHTMTGHAILAGVPAADAAAVGNAVRTKAKVLGVQGVTAYMVRKTSSGVVPVRGAKRYTVAQVAMLLHGYNPRVAKYVAAKDLLVAYAGN